jgi:predicted TIM-barrel fold metal-dependent hydrolase
MSVGEEDRVRRVIDVHSHHYPAVFLEACRDPANGLTTRIRSDGGVAVMVDGAVSVVIPQPEPSIADRLAVMDRAGIDIQLLSLSAPNVYPLADAVRVGLTRAANDELIDMSVKSGGRLQSLVSLPLPDVDASVDEFRRVIDRPGVAGVFLCTTVNGRPLDDPAFEPVLGRLSDRGVTVLVHPTVGSVDNQREFALSLNIGFMAETTTCISRLLFSGALERWPGITWVFSHLGGTLPFVHHRIAKAHQAFADWQRPLQKDPAETLRGVYFDTVTDHRPALTCAMETYGDGSLLFGTDYPHTAADLRKPLALIQSALPARASLDRVLGGTAEKIFKISDPTSGRKICP